MTRSSGRALAALLLVLGMAACRGAATGEAPAGRAAVGEATPGGLLPTPTLAAGAATADPLRPPTP